MLINLRKYCSYFVFLDEMELEKVGFTAIEQLWSLLRKELPSDEAGLFFQENGDSWQPIFSSGERIKCWLLKWAEKLRQTSKEKSIFKLNDFEAGNVLVLFLNCSLGRAIGLFWRKFEPFGDYDLKVARVMVEPISFFLSWLPKLESSSNLLSEGNEPILKEMIIGESETIKNLRKTILRIRGSDAPVLIVGESGTGKELVAKAIHLTGLRKEASLVVINCGAIPEHLLESELFGYVRGAFTGALRDKPGLVEEADGGTLFLDEISDLAFPLQAKLLRLIQEKEFRRIGDTKLRHSNVRFLSATNRNLEEEIKAGRFREDLFYRLKIITLELPPLRERKEDLLSLMTHFMKIFGLQLGKPTAVLSPVAFERLLAYDWPGNIRELQNEIQRALILCGPEAVIEEKDLSSKFFPKEEKPGTKVENFFSARAEFERRFLRVALARYNYNRTKTADSLGLSRQGLTKLLKKHCLLERKNFPD